VGVASLRKLPTLLADRLRRNPSSGGALMLRAMSCGSVPAARPAAAKAPRYNIPAGAAPTSASCRSRPIGSPFDKASVSLFGGPRLREALPEHMGVVHHAEPLTARDPTVHIVPRVGDITPKDEDADCHQYPENNLQHLFALSAWLLASLRDAAAPAAWRCWRRRTGPVTSDKAVGMSA
jgi:hypothetical protein